MTLHRAVAWLHAYTRRYPEAAQQYARLFAAQQAGKLAAWPSWCWCPLAGAEAVWELHLSTLVRMSTPAELSLASVDAIAALAAWRATQGIYRLDPTLAHELLNTPLTGEIPTRVLSRLPEWCPYVELPDGLVLLGARVYGFWAHLQWDSETESTELRILLDSDQTLTPCVVPLVGTLSDAVARREASARERMRRMDGSGVEVLVRRHTHALMSLEREGDRLLPGLISALLFLCADETDVPRRVLPPRLVHRKGGKRPLTPSAQKPVFLDCGTRLGAALRWATESSASDQGEGERSVRGHVRRAHWHAFWTGPRDGVREARVRWLPPIRVKLDDAPDMATVRPVE